MANQSKLLDLPPAWLGDLSLALGSEQLTLARSCKQLQQLVFRQSALRAKIMVRYDDPLPWWYKGDPKAEATAALVWAEAAQIKVHLHLEEGFARNDCAKSLLHSAALQHQELVGQSQDSPAPLQLHCITAVSFSNLTHASFLPDFLVQACPNLQELTLDRLTKATSDVMAQHTCTSIRKLTINMVDCPWQPDQDGPSRRSVAFKQRLLNLPSLTALQLTEASDAWHGVLHATISQYRAQLRALFLVPHDFLLFLSPSPGTQFPVLRELRSGCCSITSDEQLQQLLDAAPNLEYVRLASIRGLETSFADVPCTWKQLQLYDVYMGGLAKLPLSSCTSLTCLKTLFLSSRPEHNEPRTGQVAAGAGPAPVPMRASLDLRIVLYTDDLDCVAVVAPRLGRTAWHKIEVDVWCPGDNVKDVSWPDSLPLLKPLGEHLKCKELVPCFKAIKEPGVAAQLPHVFPHVEMFNACRLNLPDDVVVALVRTAPRPFKLRLDSYTPDNLVRQLQQAMREAGHELVTLVFD